MFYCYRNVVARAVKKGKREKSKLTLDFVAVYPVILNLSTQISVDISCYLCANF